MQAIEFRAIVEQGVIRIPKGLAEWQDKSVRVILLAEDTAQIQPAKQPDRVDAQAKVEQAISHAKTLLRRPVDRYLSAVRIDTRGFKFDREEANER